MAYFIIATWEQASEHVEAGWYPAFGDHDKDCVQQEMEDTYLGVRGERYEGDGKYVKAHLKIVKFARVPNHGATMSVLKELPAPK